MDIVCRSVTVDTCTVRLATASDADALARLRYEFRAGIGEPCEAEAAFVARCAPWMAARLGPGAGWRCWVVGHGREIRGMIWLSLIEKLPNPVVEPEHHAYITSFYLQPDARGAGLGSALLGACLRACDEGEVDAVILWPTPRSRTLYERHGFSVRDDVMERRG